MKQPPRIIAIEGIDGSGKGTQSRLLAERLCAMGHQAGVISFPDYTKPYGKLVGEYLNGKFGDLATAPIVPVSLLYSLNRKECHDEMRALMGDGKTLIIDRYIGSNLAHQGAKLEPEELEEYVDLMERTEHELLYLPRPDVTIFLDVDEETAHANVATKAARAYTDASHDLHEADSVYMGKVRGTYRALSDRFGWRRVSCGGPQGMRPAADINHEVFSRMYL